MKMNFAKKATALAMSVLFAVSMAGCGSSASTAKKVEVTSVEDLADLKIGVQTGTTGDSQASDAVNADSQMQRYNKGADAIQALKNGKIDCVVIDSLPAEKFVPTERLPWQPTLSSSRGSTKREMISLVSMPTFPRQSATSLVMS